MKCHVCHNKMIRVSKSIEPECKERTGVFKNVYVYVCKSCGEEYDELDNVKRRYLIL